MPDARPRRSGQAGGHQRAAPGPYEPPAEEPSPRDHWQPIDAVPAADEAWYTSADEWETGDQSENQQQSPHVETSAGSGWVDSPPPVVPAPGELDEPGLPEEPGVDEDQSTVDAPAAAKDPLDLIGPYANMDIFNAPARAAVPLERAASPAIERMRNRVKRPGTDGDQGGGASSSVPPEDPFGVVPPDDREPPDDGYAVVDVDTARFEDVVSEDDVDEESSGAIGQPVIERILGGIVIEELSE